MNRKIYFNLFCLFNLIGIFSLQSQTLSFPGAEGYGKYTTGGRGGRVVYVTNLKDVDVNYKTITGSFRAALETSGTDPITIVFNVSGDIKLGSSFIKCSRPNITIAGQTSPGGGICIRKGKVQFSGDNVIIRYIRFRVGDEFKTSLPCLDIENCQHIIVDHCSLSWAVEENMDVYDTRYTTVQYCILSEGLYNSYNSKGARSYACQWGGQYASYHHNLLANNYHRSPRINGCQSNDTVSLVDFRNNIVYNWSGNSQGAYGGEYEEVYPDSAANLALGAGSFNNFINNYYKSGPATVSDFKIMSPSYLRTGYTAAGFGKWYFNGNYIEGNADKTNYNWRAVGIGSAIGDTSNIRVTSEFNVLAVPTASATDAYTDILKNAGANLPSRDAVDSRIVGVITGDSVISHQTKLNTLDSTFSDNAHHGIINSQSEVGGWPTLAYRVPLTDTDLDGMPDVYETANGLDPNNADDRNTVNGDGYTSLEVYLNGITGITGGEPIASLSILGDTSVQVGKSLTLTGEILPTNAYLKDLTWSLRAVDTTKASIVSATGVLTGKVSGRVLVTATTTDGTGIKATLYVSVIASTGTNNLETENVLVYPNPVTDILYLDKSKTYSNAEVFDMKGNCVMKSVNVKNNSIDVSGLKSGSYILRAYTQNRKQATARFEVK